MNHLLIFGVGYTALEVAKDFLGKGWKVTGTIREADKAPELQSLGINIFVSDSSEYSDEVRAAIGAATHILISVPPGKDGDAIAQMYGGDICDHAPELKWVGYLSSLGVYGNRDGAWVDETADVSSAIARGERRILAEEEWRALATTDGFPLSIFRIAGIYGPGRCALDTVKAGTARRIVKPGQVFNRIHVGDIVRVVAAAIEHCPQGVEIYNVTDNEPTAAGDVVEFAAKLLGVEPPPEIPLEEAGLSPMGMSFYGEVKRVRNLRIKNELGVHLAYPNYRAGLTAIYSEMDNG